MDAFLFYVFACFALLAGIMGVAHVVEMLARKYIDDGRLDLEEVNEVFNAVPTRK